MICLGPLQRSFNTSRPRQNDRYFSDDNFKGIFLNENIYILINMSLKFVPNGPINNIPSLDQIMACHRPGDKPLSEALMVCLLTHICVTWPQSVNYLNFMVHVDQWWLSLLTHICVTRPRGVNPAQIWHCPSRIWSIFQPVSTGQRSVKYESHCIYFQENTFWYVVCRFYLALGVSRQKRCMPFYHPISRSILFGV